MLLSLTLLAALAGVLAGAGCLYVLAATALTVRYLRAPAAPAPAPAPAVSVLKPLHGAWPGLAETLEGYCDQAYGGPVQIVFGVASPSDPALAVVRTLKARRSDCDIEIVVDAGAAGSNAKMANVVGLAAHARHGVLVLSDADIVVAPDYLARVTAALAPPGVGLVTCLYVGAQTAGPWSQLGAMALSYGFLPSAVLGKVAGLAQPCFGSTIALTEETLAAIGGFRAFADTLADDYEIGAAVRRLGLEIAIPPMTVAHLCLEPSLARLFEHEVRWGRTVRQIDPAGYAGSLVTYPLPLALIAWALSDGAIWASALILTACGVRLAGKLAMDAQTGASAGRWWMIPARDLLSFAVFVAGFAVNTVGWQGRRFRVGRDGVLSQS